MNDFKKISRLVEKVLHKYYQLEKQPREYIPGIVLKQAEIHTISLIGDYPDINVSTLAKMRGITRGGASQMVYKLEEKGLICKRISPATDNEVCLSLSEIGQKVYQAHVQYHEETSSDFFKELENMPEEYATYLLDLLERFDQSIDERLQTKKKE